MGIKSYQDLVVWQKAMDLVEQVYRATTNFPREEVFGLTNQVRKASVSIPSNIAEGQGRQTTPDFLHFLFIARGSLQERETQILISHRLRYLQDELKEKLLELIADVGRLLNGLINSLGG